LGKAYTYLRETLSQYIEMLVFLSCIVSVLATTSPTSYFPSHAPTRSPTSTSPSTTSPSFHPRTHDLYITVVAQRSTFSPDEFGDELRRFFAWPIDLAKFVALHEDPAHPTTQLVVQVKIDDEHADQAFNRWDASANNITERSSMTPYAMVDLQTTLPIRGCPNDMILDCQPTAFQDALLIDCVCDTGLTGLGVFVYIILPIALILAIVVAVCFFLPGCPLYQRPPVDRSKYKRPPQSGDGEGTNIAMGHPDSEA